MIADKFIDLYARNSGLRDKLVAERDVVLTYALRAMVDTQIMEHLAFKLRGGTYDWDDVRRLVRTTEQIEPTEIIETVEKRFAMLHHLTELEQQVIADASSGWNEPLAERLRAEIHDLAT